MANNSLPKYDLISVYFNDREKLEYEQWIHDTPRSLLDILTDIRENGAKISISSQGDDLTPLVSITLKRARKKSAGRVFMYRHVDLEKCLRIAYFHFTVVSNYGEELQTEKNSLDW
jgi:hypothetical protein